MGSGESAGPAPGRSALETRAGPGAALTGELGQAAPSLAQPCQPLLQELPLVAGVTALLKEPVVGVLVLEQLQHGLLQLLPVHLQDEVLDDQGDVAGDACGGLLVGKKRSQSPSRRAEGPTAACEHRARLGR